MNILPRYKRFPDNTTTLQHNNATTTLQCDDVRQSTQSLYSSTQYHMLRVKNIHRSGVYRVYRDGGGGTVRDVYGVKAAHHVHASVCE